MKFWILPIVLIWSITRTSRLVSIIVIIMPGIMIIVLIGSVIIRRIYLFFVTIIRMIILFFCIGQPWWFYPCTPCNPIIWCIIFVFKLLFHDEWFISCFDKDLHLLCDSNVLVKDSSNESVFGFFQPLSFATL